MEIKVRSAGDCKLHRRNCLERFIILGEGKKVGINDVEIKAIKAKHSEPNAIGFKFITNIENSIKNHLIGHKKNKKVGYA